MQDKPVAVDRGFVRIADGLVHYRCAGVRSGNPLPIYMAHPAPGSSARILPFIEGLGRTHRVFAPDILGNGDSDAPTVAQPDLTYYADSAVRVMDALGLDLVDFFGSHAGAFIGVALALRHPDRVRRVVLDSIAVFPDDLRRMLYERYAPAVTPDEFGLQFSWAWQFLRDQKLHWPYFLRDTAHRLDNDLPSAMDLHLQVVELLKSLTTYHHVYRAVWRESIAPQLAAIHGTPLLLMASEADSLYPFLDAAVSAAPPNARKALFSKNQGPAERVAAISAFLAGT